MTSVTAAVVQLSHSLAAIGVSLLNAVLAVLHAVLALGEQLLTSVLQLVQACVQFSGQLFQGIFGLVVANFFAILILAGVYYWYTSRQRGRGVVKKHS
ncbi:hypothetical protein BKA93DRAFT_825946 [Sparassis latifolia]|uniref:Uncharacterized protein n=1 Tax=Sparassis crispa TaxID=139825 RepID=A0A401G7K2_9APHY|nr:predicted protein [Sparassis crispa]GBE78129.1 predicted protein [Sparassis crispa]